MLMMTDRPALHCPGQVQPVAGEQTWPDTKQSIWPKQKGVTLKSSRQVLINSTAEYLCALLWGPLCPITAISCVTSPKCHFQAPSHPVTRPTATGGTLGESVAYLHQERGAAAAQMCLDILKTIWWGVLHLHSHILFRKNKEVRWWYLDQTNLNGCI